MLVESMTSLLVASAIIGLTVAVFLNMARLEAKPRRRTPFGRA